MSRQLSEKPKKVYMTGLDGLRAFAVIAVVFYHMNMKWASGGFLGVTLFFVLSGYLITDILVDEWKRGQMIDFRRFWLRRARRLLPAMYTMVLIVTAWITLFERSLLHTLKDDLLSVFFYFSNWWFIYREVSYFESYESPSLVTHFWSLAVEEQFYIVWPLIIFILFFILRRTQYVMTVIVVLTLLSASWMAYLYEPGTDPTRVYYGTDTRAFSLLIGALLAFIWPSRQLVSNLKRQVRIMFDIVGVIGISILTYLMFTMDQFNTFLYYGGMVLISLLMAVVIAVVAHPNTWLSRLLSVKPLQWIGLRSYGIYLWHYPIIMLVGDSYYNDGMFSSTVVFQWVLILVMAELSWHYIENPIRKGALTQFVVDLKAEYVSFHDVWKRTKRFWQAIAILLFISIYGLWSAEPYEATKEAESDVEAVQQQERNREEEEALLAEKEEREREEMKQKLDALYEENIVVIGDSVIKDALPYLEQSFPNAILDAEIGRQFRVAPSLIEDLEKRDALGQYVIFSLGTNGVFQEKMVHEMIEHLGEDRHIFFINTKMTDPWQDRVNETLARIVNEYDHVHLIDWFTESEKHLEHFEPDRTHLRPQGGQKYAEMIERTLRDFVLQR